LLIAWGMLVGLVFSSVGAAGGARPIHRLTQRGLMIRPPA
jgi:hypothetical protein